MRPRVTGDDRGLQHIRTRCSADRLGAIEGLQPAADEELIPPCSVLLEERDWFSRRPDPRPCSRRLDLHQRYQTMGLGFLRHKFGEDAAESQRFMAKRRSHPVFASGRRITFVKDQVDDLKDRGQTGIERICAGDFKGDSRISESAFCADDSLCDRRLRDEKGARNLICRQAAEQAECERDTRLG